MRIQLLRVFRDLVPHRALRFAKHVRAGGNTPSNMVGFDVARMTTQLRWRDVRLHLHLATDMMPAAVLHAGDRNLDVRAGAHDDAAVGRPVLARADELLAV